MSALTSRYEAPESAMERDLANFRSVKSKDDFIDLISETIDSQLTSDFWDTTLPSQMETSPNSPVNNCYIASLHLKCCALYSNIRFGMP